MSLPFHKASEETLLAINPQQLEEMYREPFLLYFIHFHLFNFWRDLYQGYHLLPRYIICQRPLWVLELLHILNSIL
jgi:hypothetical protein